MLGLCVNCFRCGSLLLLFGVQVAVAVESHYPGLPPDCWDEYRVYHPVRADQPTASQLKVSHIPEPGVKEQQFSKNGGYWYSPDLLETEPSVVVFSEQEFALRLDFPETYQHSGYWILPSWVNEKLIFIRVYQARWGGVDLLFDVEREQVIWQQPFIEGDAAIQQSRETCAVVDGCRCIKKAGN